ncbi:flavodoxin [Microbacterium paludicola]|uniref:flavodoxin n=1 Tax=Microbacterium paludicola TaxID=300019 RepID=UPI0031E2B706
MDRRDFLRTGLLLTATAVGLTACAPTPTGETMPSTTPTPDATPTPTTGSRVLLAYFSRPGENYYYGDRIDLDVGNTQIVAEMIAAAITVDTYRIEPADPYPDDYEQTVDRNVQEENDNARPAIANPLPDLSGYDTVLLGCPVWNSQTPMIMRTFVEGVDLAGKTVHPFVTFAVSRMGRVRSDYTDLLPDTTITEGLAIQGEEAQQAQGQVEAWLRGIGLLKRPGFGGGSQLTEDESHGSTEEVPG